jgi:antitoxin component YwqK of YwqJK toxin-antitoxin module
MPKPLDKPPHLPFDVLTTIAHADIRAYKALLVLPRFGRRTMGFEAQKRWQHEYTVCNVEYDYKYYGDEAEGYTIYRWYILIGSGKLIQHRLDGPSSIFYYSSGQMECKMWMHCGKLHSPTASDGRVLPARITWFRNGQIENEQWYHYGNVHSPVIPDTNIIAPAQIMYRHSGQKECEDWFLYGKIHRVGAPAHIEYYVNGQMETEKWCLNGNIHRDGAPAYIWYHPNGRIDSEEWYQNGYMHRGDGPAYVHYTDRKVEIYYLNGVRMSEGDYNYRIR